MRHLILFALVAIAIGGCSTSAGGSARDPSDDTAIVLDSDAGLNKRSQALERLTAPGAAEPAAVRETLKSVLWKGGAPSPLRQQALAKLLENRSPESEADTRKFLRLRIPTESQWPVINDVCKAVAERASDPAWREVTGALIRSYSRRVPTPPDADRPERDALQALYPGQSIEQIAFSVYLKPQGEVGDLAGQSAEIVEKQRQAAWELLGRLDTDGSQRAAMLSAAPADDPAIAPLRRAAQELGVVPVTGSELAWLKGLMDPGTACAQEWWEQARQAVAGLRTEQRLGLQLRHIEPVRWSSRHKIEWLSAGRDDLLAQLESRLESRRKWRKTVDVPSGALISKELLSDWRESLVWGDVLTVLVLDEAIQDQSVVRALTKQAGADQADTSAEYGGALYSGDAALPGWRAGGEGGAVGAGFLVRGYSPRPAQRVNDRTFVAPEELFVGEGAGGRALAHYHFHVQTPSNSDYAGPGFGDLEYAANHGRACLVFTSVRKGVLNVDYYQRNGAQIDLGELNEVR